MCLSSFSWEISILTPESGGRKEGRKEAEEGRKAGSKGNEIRKLKKLRMKEGTCICI